MLVIAVATLVPVATGPPAAPSYRGKSFRHWLDQYYSAYGSRAQPSRAAEAEEAIRQMGTNALPSLIEMIRARDSFLKQTVMNLASKQTLIKLNFTAASNLRYQAQAGYQALGPTAKAQDPQLIVILWIPIAHLDGLA